jgi:hypothetical protein
MSRQWSFHKDGSRLQSFFESGSCFFSSPVPVVSVLLQQPMIPHSLLGQLFQCFAAANDIAFLISGLKMQIESISEVKVCYKLIKVV